MPVREWTSDQLATWELCDQREQLEGRLRANQCSDEQRPVVCARLNLVYAQQEERAGTQLSTAQLGPRSPT